MPVSTTDITTASISDASLLTSLSITTFLETFARDNRKEDMDKYIAEQMNITKLTNELSDKDSLFYFAWQNNEIAGYAKIRKSQPPSELVNTTLIELERIYILRKYQGNHIGTALMNACIVHATILNCNTIWLGVWEHNHNAIAFYKKWGFEFFGAHEFKLGYDIQTDQLMRKGL